MIKNGDFPENHGNRGSSKIQFTFGKFYIIKYDFIMLHKCNY